MGGKMHGGRRVSLADGGHLAERLADSLLVTGAAKRVLVCGSIRRGSPEVGDIDLVVIPDQPSKIDDWLRSRFGDQADGKAARSGLVEGVQVDVLLTTTETWGACIMHATGPKAWNIQQRARAKKKGFLLNEKGAFKDGKRVAGETEQEVYTALGWDFVEPAARK